MKPLSAYPVVSPALRSFCFLLLLLTGWLSAGAQIRMDICSQYGINIMYLNTPGKPKEYRLRNSGNFTLDISLRTDKKARFNYGAGLVLNNYAFTKENYYNDIYTNYNFATTYHGTYLAIRPFLDFAFDKRGIIRCQLGAPMGFRLAAKIDERKTYSGRYLNNIDTAYSYTAGIPDFLPQLSIGLSGNIPLNKNRYFLVLSACYTGSLVPFCKFNDTGRGLKPAQLSFGIGFGYRYQQPVPKPDNG